MIVFYEFVVVDKKLESLIKQTRNLYPVTSLKNATDKQES